MENIIKSREQWNKARYFYSAHIDVFWKLTEVTANIVRDCGSLLKEGKIKFISSITLEL